MCHVGWEPEILSPIARLAAGLYYNILSPQNTCAFQGTGSRIFSNEKLPKLHSVSSTFLNPLFWCPELSIFEVNEQEKTEDKNLDVEINFAVDDNAHTLLRS